MNNKKQLYTIEWSQPYNKEWQQMQEALVETMVEYSELKEANAILKQIMEQ